MLRRAFPGRVIWGGLLSILMAGVSWAGPTPISPTALAPPGWPAASRLQQGRAPGRAAHVGTYVRMPLRGEPRLAVKPTGTVERVVASVRGLSEASQLGDSAQSTDSVRLTHKRTFRDLVFESVLHRPAGRQPELRLGVTGIISAEGRRFTLPDSVLSGRPAKGLDLASMPLDPLQGWNPYPRPTQGNATVAGNARKRTMPRNEPFTLAATPRTMRQSEWQAEAASHTPFWLPDSPWTDRILLGFSRLTLAVKIEDKSSLKLALNDVEGVTPETAPKFDFATLTRQTLLVAEAGHGMLTASAELVQRSLEGIARFELASILPSSSDLAVQSSSPLAALHRLPSVATVSSRVRLIPSAAHGLSAASHDWLLRSCRSAWVGETWAAMNLSAEPQR